MQPVKEEERVLGFCCLFSPPAWPCCCIRRAKWFWDEKYSGPDPWIGGAVGGCDAFFTTARYIFTGMWCTGMLWNHLQPPPRGENCSSTRSSVSTGRLIVGVCRGVKWAAGSAGGLGRIFGYFWAGRILFELGGYFWGVSGCGLERNGSAAAEGEGENSS